MLDSLPLEAFILEMNRQITEIPLFNLLQSFQIQHNTHPRILLFSVTAAKPENIRNTFKWWNHLPDYLYAVFHCPLWIIEDIHSWLLSSSRIPPSFSPPIGPSKPNIHAVSSGPFLSGWYKWSFPSKTVSIGGEKAVFSKHAIAPLICTSKRLTGLLPAGAFSVNGVFAAFQSQTLYRTPSVCAMRICRVSGENRFTPCRSD